MVLLQAVSNIGVFLYISISGSFIQKGNSWFVQCLSWSFSQGLERGWKCLCRDSVSSWSEDHFCLCHAFSFFLSCIYRFSMMLILHSFGHQDVITGLDSLSRECCVTAGGRDRTVRVWKIAEESQLVFHGHEWASVPFTFVLVSLNAIESRPEQGNSWKRFHQSSFNLN